MPGPTSHLTDSSSNCNDAPIGVLLLFTGRGRSALAGPFQHSLEEIT